MDWTINTKGSASSLTAGLVYYIYDIPLMIEYSFPFEEPSDWKITTTIRTYK